jgi:hypothetical protein
MKTIIVLGFLFFLSFASAQTFIESSSALGISHTLISPVDMGAGVSFFDFDNDGLDDITLVQQGDSAQFYKNMGGYFELQPSLIFGPNRAIELIWVDYDNDGDNDLFLSAYNGTCRLLQNMGNMQFTDVTLAAGLFGLNSANYGASFADFDKDGDLDLYLCRYQPGGDASNPLLTNRLFRNNGNGTFTDVTNTAGVANGTKPSFMGIWFDYNNDTWPDLYIINDKSYASNTLYNNNGDGTFSDVTLITNSGMVFNGFADDPMSATFADFDNDGDNDLYASNTGGPGLSGRLLVAQSNLVFTEEAAQRNVDIDFTSWGATFIDADNDSWQDLYVTTGTQSPSSLNDVRSYFYRSNASANFTDSPQNFSNSSHVAASFSVAKGDINNDGFTDMVVLNTKGTNSYLWLNEGTSQNNYVKITLEGTLSNRMAIGSWIRVYVDANIYYYYTRCGENYCSQNSQHHIFGLGQYENIDSIEVTYLSGITDVYYNLEVNENYYFTEGETLVFAIITNSNSTICEGNSIILSSPEFSSYLWSNGETTQNVLVNEPGQYFLSAINNDGFVYQSDTITVLVVDAVYITHEIQDALCFGQLSGSVELSLFNQNDDYTLTWSNGASGLSQNDLEAGVYSYSYFDSLGCSFESDFTINEPAQIVVFTQIEPESESALGSIEILVLGGVAPYQYIINDTPTTQNPIIVQAGVYSIMIEDANGCIVFHDAFVPFNSSNSLQETTSDDVIIFPNPIKENQFEFQGLNRDSIIGLFDTNGRAIDYSIEENIVSIHSQSDGLLFFVFQKDNRIQFLRILNIDSE